ncbi:Alpha/Beta hydrolase protein [Scleroderma yunnanense]
MSPSSFLTVALLGCLSAYALSAGPPITPLSTSQIDSFTPYTYYAGAAFCPPEKTLAWNCGASCQANPNFKPVASGGDGNSVQYWYVGYDPDLHTVIVAHQGTNTSEPVAVINDADILLTPLNPTLFLGIYPLILAHTGFQLAQAGAATDVLTAVQQAMSQYESTSITMVGHSLGAAISLLDSVYLPLHLPQGTSFKTINYGLPRVGDKAFADYVDANVHLTHINNKEDPVPTLPPIEFGYVHPAGEVHIEDSGVWVSCPGQDNPSKQCIVGDVPDPLHWNENDHNGPYNGIVIKCLS